MAVAHTNPILPGVYWLDVFRPFGSSTVHDQDVDFGGWLAASKGAVKVLKRELGTVIPGADEQGNNRDRLHIFYLFEVVGAPSAFPFDKLGFPTIQKLASAGITPADRNVKADDTAQAPQPAGLLDSLPDFSGLIPIVLLVLLAQLARSR